MKKVVVKVWQKMSLLTISLSFMIIRIFKGYLSNKQVTKAKYNNRLSVLRQLLLSYPYILHTKRVPKFRQIKQIQQLDNLLINS